VDANNEQVGPHDEDDMAALIAGGKVAAETLVWKEGLPDWIPAQNATEFSMLFEDYGEQATMIGGVTYAQGGFQTNVAPPPYARDEKAPSRGSSSNGSTARSAGNALGNILTKFVASIKRLFGKN
jgi:hypothetical protein